MAKPCEHLKDLTAADFPPPRTPGACEECLKEGTRWVELRECQASRVLDEIARPGGPLFSMLQRSSGRGIRVWKAPVQGRRLVGRLNVEGDVQGDLHGHGGEHRGVFVYQMDSYHYGGRASGAGHAPHAGGTGVAAS